ncbi:hypothetical protein Nepgr_016613 [Nepenthes gracilis]|uniref:Uncharacterized protein n=1 Tax=Nepenthes gracilis TaxID=150966 RepID=A0AAD3XRG7_NEPGR|nr:hypothetical protein Nepgr_016613 [Nepenthes gracilis]
MRNTLVRQGLDGCSPAEIMMPKRGDEIDAEDRVAIVIFGRASQSCAADRIWHVTTLVLMGMTNTRASTWGCGSEVIKMTH